jgi:hypothetical protein
MFFFPFSLAFSVFQFNSVLHIISSTFFISHFQPSVLWSFFQCFVASVFRCFFLCLDPAFTAGLDTYKAGVTESNLYSSIRTWRFTLVSISSEDRFQNHIAVRGSQKVCSPSGKDRGTNMAIHQKRSNMERSNMETKQSHLSTRVVLPLTSRPPILRPPTSDVRFRSESDLRLPPPP